MDWNDIKLFLALARGGSVRAAAARAGVSHSTVARRIETFEKRLGVRLFDRLSTGYVVTSAGEDTLPIAELVEEELEGLKRRLSGRDQQLSGTIRVTATDFLATHLLVPALAEFTRIYPDIEFEVISTYMALDLNKREADVALRFSKSPPEDLVGKRLATFAEAAYATPDYLDRHDFGEHPTASWIGFSRRSEWAKESDYPHLPVRDMFESCLLQLAAAKAGMGIGTLPCLLGDTDPVLNRVPPGIARPAIDLWYLTHRDLRATARLRAFSAFLVKYINRHRDLIEGRKPRAPAV